jgi:antitoxin MazE
MSSVSRETSAIHKVIHYNTPQQSEVAMRSAIRKRGNASGVIIPKSMLAEIGVAPGDAVDLSLEGGRIVITPVKRRPRKGWTEAFREIAEAGDDALVWPEFGNDSDADLTW